MVKSLKSACFLLFIIDLGVCHESHIFPTKKKHWTKRLTDTTWKYIKKVQEKGKKDTISSLTQNITLIGLFE